MSYSALPDKQISDRIERDLEVVCDEILKVTKPVCIILYGGYGRGEGSVSIEGNTVRLLKDYDILIVVKRRLPPSKIYEMSKNIHERLGYQNPLDSVTMDEAFGADILQFTTNGLSYFKDVKTYEIKVASKLLWGEDIREKITLSEDELSPWSGVRFLLRKIPACRAFSPKYLKSPPIGKEKEYIIYECGKIYLDIGTLLTLISRTYKPSYAQRAKTIKENFHTCFPELSREMPYFPKRVELFTDLKLFPTADKYDLFDPVELWFETRRDLGIVLKYYMNDYLGESVQDWAAVFEKLNHKMKTEFLNDMAIYYLARRFGMRAKFLAKLASWGYQRLFSLRYVQKLYEKERVLLLSALTEFPIFRVSTSGLMLLFSLNEDGTVNKDLFDSFVRSLGKIYPVKIKASTDAERWEEGVNCFIKADRTFLDSFYGTG